MTASDQTDVEQEHYARFTSGYGRFFTLQDVEACLGDIKDWSEYVRGSRIILSIDLAIEKDESVALWFAASSRSHLTLIKAASFKRNPENPETIAIESMQEICEHVKTLRQRGLIPHYAYADASKDGSFPDLLQQIAGVKCEPVIWSAPTKVDLMFSLRDALRAQQFTLPKPETGYHARRLIEQLLRYEYEVSAFGNYLFNRKESGHGKRWDDDYVSALAMSTRYLNSQVRAAPLARVGGAGRRNSNKWDLLVSSKRDLREEQALLSV